MDRKAAGEGGFAVLTAAFVSAAPSRSVAAHQTGLILDQVISQYCQLCALVHYGACGWAAGTAQVHVSVKLQPFSSAPLYGGI